MYPPQPQAAAPMQAPAPAPLSNPSVKQPMTAKDLAQWWEDIEKARERRKLVSRWWDCNIKKYAPALDSDPDQYSEDLNTNRDFTLVERKKADLFYQSPDVTARPSPLLEAQAALLETHTQLLNEKLGPDGVDAAALIDDVMFDLVCVAGTGWSDMGYESATVDTPMEVPDGEQSMPGAVLGLQSVPKTKTVMAPVPVYEDCFWSHVSPWQGLKPANARTTKSDRWPWIGRELEIPLRTAKRKGWVPPDEEGTAADPELHFQNGVNNDEGAAIVRGVLIYYQSSLYRDDRPHPLHQTMLVLIEGQDEPAEHKDSPYQTLDAQGRLTPDSVIGYPIHTFTLRSMTDSSDIPSDCTISRPTVSELNKGRQQMVEQREANIMAFQYNVDTLPPDALQKAVNARIGAFVGVPGEAYVGEGSIKELPHGTYPRENFQFNDYLDNDLARMHALDANQSGAGSSGEESATEAQIKQNNVNARLGKERGRLLNGYLAGVTKYSSIMQRLLPIEDAIAIVGPEKAQAWDQWRKKIPASLAFTALPDSSQRTDLAVDRKAALERYTFWANDPFVNRQNLLKFTAQRTGLPANIVNEQPPERPPEPVSVSMTIKSEDLNPLLPQYANIYTILTQQGAKGLIPPVAEALMNQPEDSTAQPEHGGKMAQMESLSRHQNDLTGGMQGSGEPAPMGPGGTLQ